MSQLLRCGSVLFLVLFSYCWIEYVFGRVTRRWVMQWKSLILSLSHTKWVLPGPTNRLIRVRCLEMAGVLEIILQVQEKKLRSGEIKLSICSWFVEQWERIWVSWFQFISALYTGRCDGQIPLSHPSQINLPHSQALSDHLLPVQKKITRCLFIWDNWADFLSLTESGILGEQNMGRLSFAGTRIYRE